jgi:hypothetical protein
VVRVCLLVPLDVAQDRSLLLPPFCRLAVVEAGVDPTVELVQVHGVDAVLEPLVLALEVGYGLVMEPLLVFVALAQRIPDEGDYMTIEGKRRKQVDELRLDQFLPGVSLGAALLVPRAVVVGADQLPGQLGLAREGQADSLALGGRTLPLCNNTAGGSTQPPIVSSLGSVT